MSESFTGKPESTERHLLSNEELNSHIVSFEPGSGINFELFTYSENTIKDAGLTQKEVESFVEAVVNYLNAPTIVDDFSDHYERREWRKGLNRQDLEKFEQNKLRINVINSVLGRIDLIDYMHEKKSGVLSRLLSNIDVLKEGLPFDSSEYSSKTLEEKIAYKNAFENFSKGIIQELVKHGLIQGQ